MTKVSIGLAACGVIVAAAATGCTGSSGGSADKPPAWAKSLGAGVRVADSRAATAGDGSPAGVVLAEMNDLKAGKLAESCALFEPSEQSACKSTVKSFTASDMKSMIPALKNFTVTYTVVDGAKALVGTTGTICDHDGKSNCTTNKDPAAFFDSGKSFAALWKQVASVDNSNSSAYTPNRLVKVNGAWYAYADDSSASAPAPPQVNPDGTVSVSAPIGRFPVPPGTKLTAVIACPKQVSITGNHVNASEAWSFYMSKLPHAGYKVTDTTGAPMFFDFTGHGYNGSIQMASGLLIVQLSTPGTPDTYICPAP